MGILGFVATMNIMESFMLTSDSFLLAYLLHNITIIPGLLLITTTGSRTVVLRGGPAGVLVEGT
jgi:hypothetical protein